MLRALVPILLLSIFIMGPGGISALSQITGIEICFGYYDFKGGYAMVFASGKYLPSMVYYEIEMKWRLGQPEWIKYVEVGAEL